MYYTVWDSKAKKERGQEKKKKIETHQDNDLKGRLIRHIATLSVCLCETDTRRHSRPRQVHNDNATRTQSLTSRHGRYTVRTALCPLIKPSMHIRQPSLSYHRKPPILLGYPPSTQQRPVDTNPKLKVLLQYISLALPLCPTRDRSVKTMAATETTKCERAIREEYNKSRHEIKVGD